MPCDNDNSGSMIERIETADKLPETIFFMLESAAFAYSMLRSWGKRLHSPIAVMVDELELADEMASKLGIFQARVISTDTPFKEFQKKLESYHDDLCVLTYMEGRYTSENMGMLLSFVMQGETEVSRIEMPVIIAFRKVIPQAYQDKLSIAVQIDRTDLTGLKREKMELHLNRLRDYILAKEQIVEHEIGRPLECPCEGRDSGFWTAIINMIGLVFTQEDADRARMSKTLCAELQKAYTMADSYEFNHQIPALFRQVFAQLSPEVCKFVEEASAAGVADQDLSSVVLYNPEHYYIPEKLFTELCKPLKEVVTVNQIKAVLAEEGILCTQGQGRIYRTIKKTVGCSNAPIRFVWLNREVLEGDITELSVAETYRARRGGND